MKLSVRTIPGLQELIHNEEKLADIQDLSLEDIIERDPLSNVNFDFDDRNILITGAGGSIGSELCGQLLKSNPKRLVLYEISEFNLYSVKQELRPIFKTKYPLKFARSLEILRILIELLT